MVDYNEQAFHWTNHETHRGSDREYPVKNTKWGPRTTSANPTPDILFVIQVDLQLHSLCSSHGTNDSIYKLCSKGYLLKATSSLPCLLAILSHTLFVETELCPEIGRRPFAR